jgi:8-oxo-dGTP diphosphatase
VPTFYFVRHAKAGSRSHWTGDDRKRPLSKKGMQQAEDLVGLFAHFPISDIMSSPYLRCVQTVEPLARARRLEVKQTPVLAEGQGLRAYDLFQDGSLDHAVLCTHGDIVWELVEDLVRRQVLPSVEEQLEKAGTWVVEVDGGSPVRARYLPAP